jgi:ABC-2 type transport system permease protein
MMSSVLRLELRRSRSLVGWLAFTMAAYTALMVGYYPMMKSNQAALDAMLKVWPKEMMAAFNITGNMTEVGTFFNVYVFLMIWPVVAAIGAIFLGTRAVAADLDRGFLDLSVSTRISRTRYLLVAIASQVIAIAAVVVVTILTIIASGIVIGESWDAGRFALAGLLAILFGCAIASLTTLLGVISLSRGVAGGAVAGLLVAMYLLQTLVNIDPKLDWLSYVGVFRYMDVARLLTHGEVPLQSFAVLAGATVVCWAAALWAFRGRDLLP